MPLTQHIKSAQSPLSIISLNRITRLQDSLSKTLTANLFFSFLHLHPISDQVLVSFFHDVLSPLTSPLSSPPGCLSDDCSKLLPVSLCIYPLSILHIAASTFISKCKVERHLLVKRFRCFLIVLEIKTKDPLLSGPCFSFQSHASTLYFACHRITLLITFHRFECLFPASIGLCICCSHFLE